MEPGKELVSFELYSNHLSKKTGTFLPFRYIKAPAIMGITTQTHLTIKTLLFALKLFCVDAVIKKDDHIVFRFQFGNQIITVFYNFLQCCKQFR